MIEPTIGRVVWYHPPNMHEQPWAALVVFVHNSGLVNLTVFDDNGMGKAKLNVPLLQDDQTADGVTTGYCEWMTFQKGQAAKQEAGK